jgi:hypothetical protein
MDAAAAETRPVPSVAPECDDYRFSRISMISPGSPMFILGLLCAIAHSDRGVYRLEGVTLIIVMSVPRTGPVVSDLARRKECGLRPEKSQPAAHLMA